MTSRDELHKLRDNFEKERRARIQQHEDAIIQHFVKIAKQAAQNGKLEVWSDFPWTLVKDLKTQEVVEILRPHFQDCTVSGDAGFVYVKW